MRVRRKSSGRPCYPPTTDTYRKRPPTMKLLDRLERKCGRYAIPNLTVYLIAGQSLFYVLNLTGKIGPGLTYLSGEALLEGEWWRLATFPFDPPRLSPLFVLFAWYFFYLMGSALEAQWGEFRYNVFL